MKCFPKTMNIPTLPLFIDENQRVSEGRQRFTRCMPSESRFETACRLNMAKPGETSI